MHDNSIENIVCIGAAVWDFTGRALSRMRPGSDVTGRIERRPGGVALNVAMSLSRSGIRSIMLTSMGDDSDGAELLEKCRGMGLLMDHVHISERLPTDRCLVVEDIEGMIAILADLGSLEAADDRVLHPLFNGTLGSPESPYSGIIVFDGNLSRGLVARVADDPSFSAADLRVVCASPEKAERLKSLVLTPNATFYVNLEEASALCDCRFTSSPEAARAIRERGATRVLVTNGKRPATDSGPEATVTATPPEVDVARISGAGDSFVASHVAAEARGADPVTALNAALRAAADHVSGATST